MKVLVAGGAGFIGSHLVDLLVSEGFDVVVVDNLFSGNLKNLENSIDKIKFFNLDVSNLDSLSKIFNDYDFDVVVNLVARGDLASSVKDPISYHNYNVNTNLNLLYLFSKHASKDSHYIFTSSGSVYKDLERPLIEEDELQPLSPYAATKLISEIYNNTFGIVYGFKVTNLRLFNVYGPRRERSKYCGVVTRFLTKVYKDEPVTVFGNNTRDYIYVEDVINVMLKVIEKGITGTYNVGTGVGITNLKLLEIIEKVLGKRAKVIYEKERPGDSKYRVANVKKLKEIIGYTPRIGLEEGIRKLKQYFGY